MLVLKKTVRYEKTEDLYKFVDEQRVADDID